MTNTPAPHTFITPQVGKTYTIWEILWLSRYFKRPVIYQKVRENNYLPHERTIQNWLSKSYFNEERIRKLLRYDEVGSGEWKIKINILSMCGYAPGKDELHSMFGYTQPQSMHQPPPQPQPSPPQQQPPKSSSLSKPPQPSLPSQPPIPQQIIQQHQPHRQQSPPSSLPSSSSPQQQQEKHRSRKQQQQQQQQQQTQQMINQKQQHQQPLHQQPIVCDHFCPRHMCQRQQQHQLQQHQIDKLSSPSQISCRRSKRLKLKESTSTISIKATSPRRSKRISAKATLQCQSQRTISQHLQQKRVRQVTKVNFRSKTLQLIIEKEGLDKAVNKVLSDLFLHPFRKPSVGGMKGIIISFNSAYGNPMRSNIDRYSYGRQSYSLSHCDNQQQRRSDRLRNIRDAYVYGAGSGASSFGDSCTQMTCREMSTEMKLIRSKLQEIMVETFAGDNTVNTDVNLNTCELIMYYNDKGIPYHRDMTFSRDGKYIEKKNSQVENTPVVILAVGDTRELEFALHNYDGYRQQDKPKIIKLSHGTVFMLHPSDEKDSSRIINGESCVSHFRHKSKGVKGRDGSLSIGFVFRCTKSRQLVNKFTGQYIINKTEKSVREMIFDKQLDDYFADQSLKEYHEQFLKELYIDMRDKFIIKK